MSFQRLIDQIEKGLPSPVYFLYASDPFLHREALVLIKRLVPEEERDFNFHIFDLALLKEENLSFERILEVVHTVSFFGSRRVTVLTGNLQKMPKKDLHKLDEYISNPAPESVFIMLHEGTVKKEMRERFKRSHAISLDMREGEIPSWIKQRAIMNGIAISHEAVDYLIGIIGPDLGLLAAEIEKIALLGQKRIDVHDISDIIEGGRLYSTFDLVDALKEKDVGQVFKIYKTLRDVADDYGLIGALNWHYGRSMHTGGGKNDEYLSRVFNLLHSADKDIKSSGRTFPMEYLLVKLLRL
jgi:DNA polymerase III delta subunit